MGSTIILLGALGFVFWVLFDRPRLTGRLNGQRVYLRQGPGLGAVAVAVIAFVYVATQIQRVEQVLFFLGMGAALVATVVMFLRRSGGRSRSE